MAGALTTRDTLLAVGLKKLRAEGYTATGVKDILDAANVPKGSFYHYFPSKEAFASELLKQYAAGEFDRVGRLLGDTSIPPLVRLRSYFEDLITVYGLKNEISGCLLGALSLEMADHSTTLQTQLKSVFESWQGAIEAVIRQAVERGDVKPTTEPDKMADFLLNSYEGALVRMKADRSERPLDTFLHFAFDVLLVR